jgi:hypothetical protein
VKVALSANNMLFRNGITSITTVPSPWAETVGPPAGVLKASNTNGADQNPECVISPAGKSALYRTSNGASVPPPANRNSRAGGKAAACPNPLSLEKGGKVTVPEMTSVVKLTASTVIVPDPLVITEQGGPKKQLGSLAATARVGDRSKRMSRRLIFAPSVFTFAHSLVISVDYAREDVTRLPRRERGPEPGHSLLYVISDLLVMVSPSIAAADDATADLQRACPVQQATSGLYVCRDRVEHRASQHSNAPTQISLGASLAAPLLFVSDNPFLLAGS